MAVPRTVAVSTAVLWIVLTSTLSSDTVSRVSYQNDDVIGDDNNVTRSTSLTIDVTNERCGRNMTVHPGQYVYLTYNPSFLDLSQTCDVTIRPSTGRSSLCLDKLDATFANECYSMIEKVHVYPSIEQIDIAFMLCQGKQVCFECSRIQITFRKGSENYNEDAELHLKMSIAKVLPKAPTRQYGTLAPRDNNDVIDDGPEGHEWLIGLNDGEWGVVVGIFVVVCCGSTFAVCRSRRAIRATCGPVLRSTASINRTDSLPPAYCNPIKPPEYHTLLDRYRDEDQDQPSPERPMTAVLDSISEEQSRDNAHMPIATEQTQGQQGSYVDQPILIMVTDADSQTIINGEHSDAIFETPPPSYKDAVVNSINATCIEK